MSFDKRTIFPYLIVLLFSLGIGLYNRESEAIRLFAQDALLFPLLFGKVISATFFSPGERQTLFGLLTGIVLTILFWTTVIEALREPRTSSHQRGKNRRIR